MLLKVTVSQFDRLYPIIKFNKNVNVKGKNLVDKVLRIYNVHQEK